MYLEDTEDCSQAYEGCPVRHEAETDHNAAPEKGDCGEEDARANFAAENSGGWLKDGVGDEED